MNRQVVATERLSVSRLHRRWEKKANLPGNRRSDMFVHVNLKAGIRSPSAHPGSPVPAVCSPGVRKKLSWNHRMLEENSSPCFGDFCNCWGNLWSYLVFFPILCFLCFTDFTFLRAYCISSWLHLLRKGSVSMWDSHPNCGLFFSFSHFAADHHLERYPTIKSFFRNLAPQWWNAIRSRSDWAAQSHSWSVLTLLFLQKCHLSCSWQKNRALEETSEGVLNTKQLSSSSGAAAVWRNFTCSIKLQ